jgi:hypothetical protein
MASATGVLPRRADERAMNGKLLAVLDGFKEIRATIVRHERMLPQTSMANYATSLIAGLVAVVESQRLKAAALAGDRDLPADIKALLTKLVKDLMDYKNWLREKVYNSADKAENGFLSSVVYPFNKAVARALRTAEYWSAMADFTERAENYNLAYE